MSLHMWFCTKNGSLLTENSCTSLRCAERSRECHTHIEKNKLGRGGKGINELSTKLYFSAKIQQK